MLQKLRKTPFNFDSIKFNGNSNRKEVEIFIGKELKVELESETAYLAGKAAPIFSLLIETSDGIVKLMKNDWIVKDSSTTNNDFYICKNYLFNNQNMKYSQTPNELQNKLDSSDVNQSLFLEKIWNNHSKIISDETNLMNKAQFLKAMKHIFPTVDEVGITGVIISEKIKPELTAQEQAFFVAGFQECLKWLISNER